MTRDRKPDTRPGHDQRFNCDCHGESQPRVVADSWMPEYERWRHGGWYVANVVYPSGAVGCVSRNYPDGKWRIVCHPLRENGPTFPNRDAAARAERILAGHDVLAVAGEVKP